MSSVWSAVRIDCVVGISVVGNDYSLIVVSNGSLDNILNASVNCNYGLLYCAVDACVTYHIAVSEVYNDEVELILVD